MKYRGWYRSRQGCDDDNHIFVYKNYIRWESEGKFSYKCIVVPRESIYRYGLCW